MSYSRRHFFSLHDLLTMAALAALGGASSSAISMVGKALSTASGIPGCMQFMAGIHVLWLVLAIGLIGRPGAATATGLLKGGVELLTGNQHGLLVVLYCVLAGLCVDAVWLLLGRRNHPITLMLAGGLGAASNIVLYNLAGSLPAHRGVHAVLVTMAGIAFLSGAVLAGLLGYWLLGALHRAGVIGARSTGRFT